MDVNYHLVKNTFLMKIPIIMMLELKLFFVTIMVFGQLLQLLVMLTTLLI